MWLFISTGDEEEKEGQEEKERGEGGRRRAGRRQARREGGQDERGGTGMDDDVERFSAAAHVALTNDYPQKKFGL